MPVVEVLVVVLVLVLVVAVVSGVAMLGGRLWWWVRVRCVCVCLWNTAGRVFVRSSCFGVVSVCVCVCVVLGETPGIVYIVVGKHKEGV